VHERYERSCLERRAHSPCWPVSGLTELRLHRLPMCLFKDTQWLKMKAE